MLGYPCPKSAIIKLVFPQLKECPTLVVNKESGRNEPINNLVNDHIKRVFKVPKLRIITEPVSIP